MPRVRKIAKRRNDYTDHELHVLCTGVPLSPASTRFGGPKPGWNHEALTTAFNEVGEQVRSMFKHPEYTRYLRCWDGQPWIVHYMSTQGGPST
jgi:hypothetical protein